MSDLFENSEDRFSRDMAQIKVIVFQVILLGKFNAQGLGPDHELLVRVTKGKPNLTCHDEPTRRVSNQVGQKPHLHSWRYKMGDMKPDFFICENKDADQLRGNREADHSLCFR